MDSMMPIPATESTNSARTSLFAVCALLLLAASQLAIAEHQFEHVADDVFEVCGVCLQLDRSGEALGGDIEIRSIAVAPYALPVLAEVTTAETPQKACQPRGPPTA